MADTPDVAAAAQTTALGQQILDRTDGIRQSFEQAGHLVGMTSGILTTLGPAIDVSVQLQQLANVAGLAPDSIAAYGRSLTDIATATGQTAGRLAAAFDGLVSSDTAPADAIEVVRRIAVTSQATGIDTGALTTSAARLINGMSLSAADVGTAFEMLAITGQSGVTDIRAAAQALPALIRNTAPLGLTGTAGVASIAAALQVSGEDPVSATAGLDALLAALASRETAIRAGRLGVDLQASVTQARAAGIDPLQRMLDDIRRATGGSLPALDRLFGDELAADAATRIMQQTDRYGSLRAQLLSMGAGTPGRGGIAQGAPPSAAMTATTTTGVDTGTGMPVLEAAANRVGDTAGGSVERMVAAWQGTVSALLDAMAPDIAQIAGIFTETLDGVTALIRTLPDLAAAIGLATAAVAGLSGAAGIAGGAAKAAGALGGAAGRAGGLAAGLGTATGLGRMMAAAAAPAGAFLLANPLAIAGILAAITIVYFWDDIADAGQTLIDGLARPEPGGDASGLMSAAERVAARRGGRGNTNRPAAAMPGPAGMAAPTGAAPDTLLRLLPATPQLPAAAAEAPPPPPPPSVTHNWHVTVNVSGPADGRRIADEFRAGVLRNDWGMLHDDGL